MMDIADQILSRYVAVSHISNEMLEAAREHDWELLDALGVRYVNEVGQLRKAPPDRPMSQNQRQQRCQLIQAILDNDRAIRDITQPWMCELQALMHQAGTQRKLQRAYGEQGYY